MSTPEDGELIQPNKPKVNWSTVPKASHGGELNIAGRVLQCAVLEDGRRVLTQETFLTAIGRAAKAKAGTGSRGLVDELPPFLAAASLKPFISEDLRRSTTPIPYRTVTGGRAYGFLATLLPSVCDVYVKARDADKLAASQTHIANACEILLQGLSTIGIIALVDEASGFQDERPRQALQEILERFIKDELGKWMARFPNEFYRQIFRLRNWSWTEGSIKKRPGVVGSWTSDLVYKRLAPGVLEELRKKTPRDEKGRLKHRLHQWLTDDLGHPRLQEHLTAVIALMRVSDSWDDLIRMMDKALPVYDPQLTLRFQD